MAGLDDLMFKGTIIQQLRRNFADISVKIRQPAELLWDVQRLLAMDILSDEDVSKEADDSSTPALLGPAQFKLKKKKKNRSTSDSRDDEMIIEDDRDEEDLNLLKWRVGLGVLTTLLSSCQQCRRQIFHSNSLVSVAGSGQQQQQRMKFPSTETRTSHRLLSLKFRLANVES